LRLRLALCCGVALLGAALYVLLNRTDHSPGSAPPLSGAPPADSVLARGKYLAVAADCVACHTVADSGRAFAGGVAFRLPFGTIYSSNITPDATGIGNWSDEDFVRAVREGVRNDGRHLYPAFPYTAYTQLSRSDVLAIKAYLFTLSPIRQKNRDNDLAFPFNQRWAMGFWNAAFFRSSRFEADASRSSAWNRGAYLVKALGHCGECHTPRNIGFGLKRGEELAGAELQGWRAYNLTSDPIYGIGGWTDAALTEYLSTGHAANHGSASGPMGEAVAHSLQYLSEGDIASIVVYLRGVPARKGGFPIVIRPVASLVSSDAPPPNERSVRSLGLRLFEGNCASCHEWNGEGRQSPYAALSGGRGIYDSSAANVIQVLLDGADLRIGDNDVYMPAYRRAYSNTEVAALANYVVMHFGGGEGRVTPDAVAKRRNP
jgi:mono/diheme cytochrome c family protein